jgi:hypothetical protein
VGQYNDTSPQFLKQPRLKSKSGAQPTAPVVQLTMQQVMSKTNTKYIPRTGIEQPFMLHAPRFSESHKEFERIATVNVSARHNCSQPWYSNWSNRKQKTETSPT